IRQKYHLDIRGFGDMDAGEIARLTGLDLKSAGLAGEREYEETLDLAIGDSRVALIVSKIREAGLHCGPGTRLYSVSAGSDKGRATRVLISLFRREFGEIQTMGIGDGLNDLTMLREVDIPVLVQQLGGRWVDIDIENIHRISEVGPRGWVKAVRELFLD
ncbi:MAG: HAD hydrolase family protein, partial [Dehalococcoidales bacterium]